MADKKQSLAAFAALLMLTACSGSHNDEPGLPAQDDAAESGPALAFSPSIPAWQSSRAPLQDVTADFALLGWKGTGSERQTVFSHSDGSPYQVRFLDGEWRYDILSLDSHQQYMRYWDLSAPVYTFHAYAPYSVYDTETLSYVAASDKHGVAFADDGTISLTGAKGNVSASANPEWLVARMTRTASPLLDTDLIAPSSPMPALAEFTGTVPLVFHSLMSQVEIRAYSKSGGAFTITRFTIDFVTDYDDNTPTYIYTRANYDGRAWTALSEPEQRLFEGNSLGVTGTDVANATPLGTLIEIPQDVAGRWIKALVSFGTHEMEAFFRFPLLAEGSATDPYVWEPDKKYIYTFAIDEEQEIILFDIAIESFQWQPGNNVDVDDAETNW